MYGEIIHLRNASQKSLDFAVNPPEVDIFGWKLKKKIFVLIQCLNTVKKNKKKKEKKD